MLFFHSLYIEKKLIHAYKINFYLQPNCMVNKFSPSFSYGREGFLKVFPSIMTKTLFTNFEQTHLDSKIQFV